MHAVIEALGAGPVEMFASSWGAVTAFALVAGYPDDVTTLVAHEPPLIPVLPSSSRPDVDALTAAASDVVLAVGEESLGGFLGGEFGYAGQPEAFARKLREDLDENN